MPRFLTDADYDFKIRSEISRLLDNTESKTKLKVAEDTAIAMVRMYIGGRFDCNVIFAATLEERNKFIMDIVISIALYKLYHQLGMKDIPEHRKVEYDDALEWLKMAGKGEIDVSDLPTALSDTNPGEFILQSRPPENHRY